MAFIAFTTAIMRMKRDCKQTLRSQALRQMQPQIVSPQQNNKTTALRKQMANGNKTWCNKQMHLSRKL